MSVRFAPPSPRVVIIHTPGRATSLLDALGGGDLALISVRLDRAMLRELDVIAPAAVVVDHSANDFDVDRVCRDVRVVPDVRIMVVSDLAGDVNGHVALLEAGADDVIAPDAPPQIVRARVHAMVRAWRDRARIARIRLGDLDIDLEAYVVKIDGVVVPCPRLQFNLLVLLAQRPNVLLTIPEITARLWGRQLGADSAKARGAVSALRRILGRGSRRPAIESVAKVGYRLSVPRELERSRWMLTVDGRVIESLDS